MAAEDRSSTRHLRLLGLVAALALSAAAAWPQLAAPGLINTRAGGDSPFLLLRLYELQANLRAGVLPARWMPDAAFGLGYPFFNYYASLPYYLAAALSLAGAGILWALKLTQLLGFLGAAAAMYALVDDLLADPWAALGASAAYTFAPFHLANVYVRGDSLSEFYAFVFYALILWGIVRLRRAPTVGHLALLAASYAGLMLTHNISAFIFTPLAGLALLAAGLSAPRRRLQVLLAGSAAFLLGAALSAWFWVPALLERSAVSLADMTTGYFSYSGHFRGWDLVQPAMLFAYVFDKRLTPFAVGGLQAGLTAAGLLVIAASWARQRRLRWGDLALVPLLAYAVWPITPSSAVAWQRVPLLPMVQFPWRFLSIVALGTALVAGVALSRLGRARWLAGPVAVACAVAGLALLPAEPLPIREADVTPERLQLYEQFTGNIGSTVRAEWLPVEAVPPPSTSAGLLSGERHPLPLAAEGALGEASLLAAGPTEQAWEVTVASPQALLVFQTYAFPGWKITVDGQPAAIRPGVANGRLAVQVARGRHQVALRLGPTPLRAAAERSSVLAGLILLGLAGAGLWHSRRQWRRMLLALALVAATLGAGALLGHLGVGAAPPSSLATETMDFDLLPYLHPNPSGVAFGPSTRLLGYELSAPEVGAGDVLRLRLHWRPGSEAGLRAVVRLTTAAEIRHRVPSLAAAEAPLGPVTEHTLTVPPEAAPGLALLAVEVEGPQGKVKPHTGLGTPLGTTYLAPVRVRPPALAPGLPAQDHLGQSVDVLQASVSEAPRGGWLAVRLTWRAAAPLGQDYVTSLRLYGPDGRLVPGAKVDVQPRYGLYPTSLWPVGQPVADYYELQLPRGTAPGPGYQVEAALYDRRTLAKLGSVRLPEVTLAQPTVDPDASVLHAFKGGLALTSGEVTREEVEDGDTIVLDLQWTARSAPQPDAVVRLTLQGTDGRVLAESQAPLSPAYPPSRWPAHALVNTRLRLPVPPGTPPGKYRLDVRLLDPRGEELGLWSPKGRIRVKAAQRNMTLPAFGHPLGVDFGGLIRLPGYDLERSASQVAVTFHWQALRAPGRDYKVFLHCVDPASGEIVAQQDAMPRGDTYPTGRWAQGEVVSDRLVLDMAGVPAGRYRLLVGWYDPQSGERLEPSGGSAPVSNRRVLLQEVKR